jgi:hypothetical protein
MRHGFADLIAPAQGLLVGRLSAAELAGVELRVRVAALKYFAEPISVYVKRTAEGAERALHLRAER